MHLYVCIWILYRIYRFALSLSLFLSRSLSLSPSIYIYMYILYITPMTCTKQMLALPIRTQESRFISFWRRFDQVRAAQHLYTGSISHILQNVLSAEMPQFAGKWVKNTALESNFKTLHIQKYFLTRSNKVFYVLVWWYVLDVYTTIMTGEGLPAFSNPQP